MTEESKLNTSLSIMRLTPEQFSELGIVYPGMPQYELLNAMREVRSNLVDNLQKDKATLLVSSISNHEPAEKLTLNLAAVFALESQKRALIIDCNPYSPIDYQAIGTVASIGLTEYLSGETNNLSEIVYHTGIEKVAVIPAGLKTATAAELYNNRKMQNTISKLQELYQDSTLIINSPPVDKHSEARFLTKYCDVSLLSVLYGKSSKSQVLSASDALDKSKFAGVVFQY